MTVRGRTALVTGASSGIGAAAAAELAAHGCQLVLVGRDQRRLAEVAERTGGRALAAELTDPTGLDRVVTAARRVDLLVHCAGVGWAGDLASMSAEQVEALMAVNLTAPVLLTSAVLPELRRRRGHVVFVSSIAVVGVRDEEVYAATKAGVRAFAESLRHLDDIGVTTVFPGAVRTPFFAGRRYDRRFPRMLTPQEVAAALVRGVQRGRAEVFVPAWLAVPARLQGALPGLFRALARRFG
ncbi:SDR family NAD(P)-dependent oxidoreductase [Saccharopolyspora hirsuta]|uniref:SDR family NAD(P)-dependent oxidoreductase n=1 Tax=Saccharopolyspora hirsuta TaxID=1837 RepID=A0A5M7BYS4_SACHI|nr:SDR family NAD(P)-dependent oxidoreductase [Saccharopolyspora hirsuta]KAA5834633.1 SDR family NAD(P)-dependent oxidoreductase [Saccharopolyspora hirsuta]